ncbi:hypothetical protein [Capnocytophaga felis]|nr:hypothetical protein [Capnocytophaga felis]
MSGRAGCWDTASIPRADCYGRATASKCKHLIINHSFEYILYL